MNLQSNSGQPNQPDPGQQYEAPGRGKERIQQRDQASRAARVTGGEGVAVKVCVEPTPLSWRSLATEKPFEDGRDRTGDQCADQHPPPKVSPGSVPPQDGRYSTGQPERAVATVGGDEREQTQAARLVWNGEARRYLPVVGDELS